MATEPIEDIDVRLNDSTLDDAERIEIVVRGNDLVTLRRTAAFFDRSLAEQVSQFVQTACEDIRAATPVIRLSPEDYEALLSAIENPPAPSENLKQLAQRYREVFGEE